MNTTDIWQNVSIVILAITSILQGLQIVGLKRRG